MTAEVVQLKPCNDIAEMLRRLAGEIERGEVAAQEAVCVIRTGVDRVRLYGWGDYRGNIAALGLLEAAKREVHIESD